MNIGIIGYGSWSKVIIDEINNNNKFNLTAIVSRSNKIRQKNLKIFETIKEMIDSNIIDCIFVAAYPDVNFEVIKLNKIRKIPLILEKPLCVSLKKAEQLKKIVEDYKLIVFPNLSNFFSESFFELKKEVDKNLLNIKRIIIYEGSLGPFRNNINPIWDWGFHPISIMYILFENYSFTRIQNKKLKSNNLLGKGIVSKFSFKINNSIKVDIVTGNLFKRKTRQIKLILNNNDFILSDMITHKLYLKNNLKFQNKNTPICSLLNCFEKDIKLRNYNNSLKLIKASVKTIRFLEQFYRL